MPKSRVTSADKRRIAQAVERFKRERGDIEHLAKLVHVLLGESPQLKPYIHSVRWRVKEESHLEHKLIRKTKASAAEGFSQGDHINADNLFDRIEDLAGVRILHLHTSQFEAINKILLEVLAKQNWVITGPEANTWDDEYRDFFKKMGVATVSRVSLYTSVHYILKTNAASPYKCELQVRTLAEEIWGEVSHTIDYPEPTKSIACKEQLKVLARLSSSYIRLVDSLFESEREFKDWK